MLYKSSHRRSSKLVLVIVSATILVLACLAGFFFWQYNKLKNNSDTVNKENTQRVLEKVGELYELPTNEEPTVAEIKDRNKLKDQAFFKNAKDGDVILIYTSTKLALIYRESQNKLINVGPIAISSENEPATKPSVTVRNGSGQNGKAASVAADLKTKLGSDITISETYTDAKARNTGKTLVVDLTGKNADAITSIADALGGQAGALPQGEPQPDTDILVIVGL